MSASINSEKFAKFFQDTLKKACPVVEIPGRLHQVSVRYLEDVVKVLGIKTAPKPELRNDTEKRAFQIKYGVTEGSFLYKLENPEDMDHELIAKVVHYLHKNKPMDKKAILVFVPGWDSITALEYLLGEEYNDDNTYNGYYLGANAKILLLHSEIKISDQELVHMEFPGQRKIIISTNIAEASITIEDVAFVVDCGKAKVSKYDFLTKHSKLEPLWISQANVKQRLGRAGRVQFGEYWALFTKVRFDLLDAYPEPDSKRRSLEETVLHVKCIIGNDKEPSLATFFAKMMDPPHVNTVVNAIQLLQGLAALDSNQNLTSLGHMLEVLPVHPYWGKLCIAGKYQIV